MEQTITATYTGKEGQINGNHRKENRYSGQHTAIVVVDGKPVEVAECRYYDTDSTAYCCLWVHDNASKTWTSGSGKAGGYGYHRASAAAQNAINKAGFTLSQNIGGGGSSMIEDALKAIAAALHPDKTAYIMHAHA